MCNVLYSKSQGITVVPIPEEARVLEKMPNKKMKPTISVTNIGTLKHINVNLPSKSYHLLSACYRPDKIVSTWQTLFSFKCPQ